MELNKKEVFLIAATSEDGFISPLDKTDQSSTKWTSPEDTKFFSEITKEAGVVIYGSKTYQTIPEKYRPLKDRLNIVYTRHPNSLTSGSDPEVLEANESPSDLSNPSNHHLFATQLSPKNLIDLLNKQGHYQIAICGGHSIYELFISSGVVDKAYQTIEPIQFGEGIPFLSDKSKRLLSELDTISLSKSTKVKVFDVIK